MEVFEQFSDLKPISGAAVAYTHRKPDLMKDKRHRNTKNSHCLGDIHFLCRDLW